MTIHGKLERYYGGVVSGWAASREAPAGISKVVLLVDGQPVAEVPPSIPRRDVERAGFPLLSGVQLSVPDQLLDGGVHEIALAVDGVVIPGGPRTVTLSRPRETRLREVALRDPRVIMPSERVRLRVDHMVGDRAQLHHFLPEGVRDDPEPYYETDDINVYEIDDCMVLFPDGVVIAGDELFDRTLFLVYRERYAEILRSDGTLVVDEANTTLVTEPTFLFHCGSQNNYFHWHMDVLPKCLALDEVHRPGMRLAIPKLSAGFQRETVSRITARVATARPVSPNGLELVRFRKLFYAPGLSGDAVRPSPAIARFFEDDLDDASAALSDPPKRIYLTRGDNPRRRLVNEELVTHALRARGFTLLNPGDLTVREQRHLFRHCELVVGPHGAAFTNLLYTRSCAGVVELFPDRYMHVGVQRIANLKGFPYGFVLGKTLGYDAQRSVHDVGFEVDVDEVLRRVDEVARLVEHEAGKPPRSTQQARVGRKMLVHVGPGKTGTSALQAWLTTHRDELHAAGVDYPAHDLDPNRVSSGNRDHLLDLVDIGGSRRHVVSPAKAGVLRDRLRDGDCHTLLLSSEFFSPEIPDIQREFPEAQFVFYVRDPIELLESDYNQRVKRHDETRAFTPPAVFRAGIFAQLQRLLGAERPPRLIVRPYGEQLFAGGDIVHDLLSVLGVSGIEDVTVSRVNRSYSVDALEFKRHANHFALGPLQPVIDCALQEYAVGEREYSLVPSETFAAMRRACVEQLDRLLSAHPLEALYPLRDHLTHGTQRPYVRQVVSDAQLFAVADYLEASEPETFEHLRARVRRTPDLALPNPGFYARFL